MVIRRCQPEDCDRPATEICCKFLVLQQLEQRESAALRRRKGTWEGQLAHARELASPQRGKVNLP